uniref:Uncharacterized protein n=1 Tax=Trypanosoma congolense (strain IL3000) TaxID=1068625 RepID=G0UL89_TRYCI|nr:conserved hypothetical protein [Trypanosoma congolense IL3000]
MEPLDLLPYEAALHRLLRAGLCSDDQMHDYFISQAFRSLTYAVNRKSLPVPVFVQQTGARDISRLSGTSGVVDDQSAAITQPLGNASTTTGAICVLCRMCVQLLTSPTSHRTVAYLSTRLLMDEATAFGEGNERPCCTAAWVEALCSVGKDSYLRQQLEVNRRVALGYLYTLAETVRSVSRGRLSGKRLSSQFVDFTRRILDDVLPQIALLAGAREDFAEVRHPRVMSKSPDAVRMPEAESLSMVEAGHLLTWRAPSRLVVEANNTIIHLFHDITHDILSVHHGFRRDTGERCMVLDRDMPSRLWDAASILQSALTRGMHFVLQEGLAHVRSLDVKSGRREVKAATEAAEVVRNALDAAFGALFKQQEAMECSRRVVEQEYGKTAKQYHEITDMMWANTLRLCFFCRSVTASWIEIHGGAGSTEAQQSDKGVLSFIASLVLSVKQLEGDETESDVFVTTVSLLAAAFAGFIAAPVPLMQSSLWTSDPALVGQVHNVIIQRGLRYRDEQVQRLSALISQFILCGSSFPGASHAVVDSADQLLELISNGRDAASHCVIRMLSRAILERPHSMLPALFRLLQHGDVMTRRNVMDILSALPQMDEETIYGEKLTAEQMRPMLRQLSDELLMRIQDDELLVRLQSSKLFAKVWPEDVFRPLLNLAMRRDKSHKRQSAAQKALRSVVLAHTTDSRVVLLLLQEALALSGEGSRTSLFVPNSPSDVLAFAKLHSCVAGRDNDEKEGDTADGQKGIGDGDSGSGSSNVAEPHSQRLAGLVFSLVKRWAETVSPWTEEVVNPVIQYAMRARAPLEQEFAVRLIVQISFHCGATMEGAVTLASCVMRVIQPDEDATPPSDEWLVGLRSSCGDASPRREGGEEVVVRDEVSAAVYVYRMVVPFICLRGCQRSAFKHCRAGDFPRPLLRLWNFLWRMLFTEEYLALFGVDVQRLMLELLCKYRASMVLEKLAVLDADYLKELKAVENFTRDGNRAQNVFINQKMCFLCRVGFFCVSNMLAQNKLLFMGASDGSSDREKGGEGEEANELSDLFHGAEMVLRWTEDVVFPWLLSDNDEEASNRNCGKAGEIQRLCRSSIDCVGLLTLVAVDRSEFSALVAPFVKRPIAELALLYREHVKAVSKCAVESGMVTALEDCPNLLGRFEFAVQVQKCALNILRSNAAWRKTLCSWFSDFTPPLIELANAACKAAACLSREDIGQVAVECCHVLFLAVMTSSANRSVVQCQQQNSEVSAKPLLMELHGSDRSALVAFAVGSTRYANLPAVQSEGVKLLSALLGAAPDIFVDEASAENNTLAEALSALNGVALLHQDPKTRLLSESVLNAIRVSEQQ